VFALALLDASQDLSSQGQFLSAANLRWIGVALVAALPLLIVGLAWQAAGSKKRLATLLAATYAALFVALVVAWSYHVYLGAAPAEGAQQAHLVLLPALSTALAVLAVLACLLIAKVLNHVVPHPGT